MVDVRPYMYFVPKLQLGNDKDTNELKNEEAPLIDLIFFPTQTMQLQIEPLLENLKITKKDEKKIYINLKQKKLWRSIKFLEKEAFLKVYIPDYALKNFIKRLHLSHQIDSKIKAKVDSFFNNKKALLIKVILRNSKKIEKEIEIIDDIIRRFLPMMPTSSLL